MNQINCPICGNKCVKAGKTKAGTQRWLCKKCKTSLTHKIDNDSKELQIFLDWLFGKEKGFSNQLGYSFHVGNVSAFFFNSARNSRS